MNKGFIPPHGGYQKRLSYQKPEIVHDGTVFFCHRFLDKRERMTRARLQSGHQERS